MLKTLLGTFMVLTLWSCNSLVEVDKFVKEPVIVKEKLQRSRKLISDDVVQARSLFYDGMDNIYITGQFSGTLSFDSDVSSETFSSLGTYSVYVVKFDSKGNYLWTKVFGDSGTSFARPKDIRVTNVGDIIILGDFNGTMDTDPGVGTVQITSNGSQDLFVIKLDSDGELVNSFNIGNTSYDESESLEVDSSGNYYYLGTINDRAAATDFDPTVGNDSLHGIGGFDVFLTKINSDNSYGWTYYIGSNNSEWPGGIDVDSLGNVTIGFRYENSIDVDPAGPIVDYSPVGSSDLVFVKVSSAGTYMDSFTVGGDGSEAVYDIHYDQNDNLYIVGSHASSNFDFDPGVGTEIIGTNGGNDFFIAKYDSSFNLNWVKSFGSTDGDRFHGLDVTNDGKVFVGGYYNGDFVLNNPGNNINITQHTSTFSDGIVFEFDQNGNYQNHYSFLGADNNQIIDLKVSNELLNVIGTYKSSELKINGHVNSNLQLSGNENSFFATFE